MPRRKKEPALKQKQKQKQSQKVVVNIGTAAAAKKRRAPRKRRAPAMSVEDAEYISALTRTIPAVQINPIPAMQAPSAGPIPATQAPVSAPISQHIPIMVQPAATSLAEMGTQTATTSLADSGTQTGLIVRQVDTPLMREVRTRRFEVPRATENRLTSSEPDRLGLPTESNWSFTPPRNIIPRADEPIQSEASNPLFAPRNIHLNSIANEPTSDPISDALSEPYRENQIPFFGSSSPAALDIPIDVPTPSFAFASTTEEESKTEGAAKRAKMSMADRISKLFGLSKADAAIRYENEISEEMASKGVDRKVAQDRLTKRYKYTEKVLNPLRVHAEKKSKQTAKDSDRSESPIDFGTLYPPKSPYFK